MNQNKARWAIVSDDSVLNKRGGRPALFLRQYAAEKFLEMRRTHYAWLKNFRVERLSEQELGSMS